MVRSANKNARKDEVKIVFCSKRTEEAYYIFNRNAFPEKLGDYVDECATKFSMFRHCVQQTFAQIEADFGRFENRLDKQNQNGELDNLLIKNDHVKIVCCYDSDNYITFFVSSLVYLKAFFDVYANLIKQSIDPGYRIRFDSGKIKADGGKISGGKFINWLSEISKCQHIELSNLFLLHSRDWIDCAVGYRNKLAHYGDIFELHRMRVVLQARRKPLYCMSEVEPPTMPDGQDVRLYVQSLADRLQDFLARSMPLIPEVKLNLVDFRRFPLDLN